MHTVLLFVLCTSNARTPSLRPLEQAYSAISAQVIRKIIHQHPSEEICLLQYDGHIVSALHGFSSQHDVLLKATSNLPPLSIVAPRSLAFALVQTFKYIQGVAGIDARAQVIVLCDSSPFEDDIFRVRPPFAAKIHFFCLLNDLPSAPSSSSENNASTTVSKPQVNHQLQLQDAVSQMKQLALLTRGGFYQFNKISPSSDEIDQSSKQFVHTHYGIYEGILAFGHLISPITLHPDPNLVLWGTEEESNSFKLPDILSIVGFLSEVHMSSPKCISKHTILLDKNNRESGSKQSLRRLVLSKPSGLAVGHNGNESGANEKRKPIRADACKSDPKDTSLYELLHEALIHLQACAILSFGDDHYGYIAVAYEENYSGLILGVLDKQCVPWLKYDLHSLVLNSHKEAFAGSLERMREMDQEQHLDNELLGGAPGVVEGDIPQRSREVSLFSTTPKAYSSPFTKGNPASIPFINQETLQSDFQKIVRAAKNLPAKQDVLYKECEKIRSLGNVYMSSSIHNTLAKFLKDISMTQQSNELLHMCTQDIVAKLEKNIPITPPIDGNTTANVAEEPLGKKQRVI